MIPKPVTGACAQDALDHAMGARAATRLTLQVAIRALKLWQRRMDEAQAAGNVIEANELLEAFPGIQEACGVALANVNAANAEVRAAVDQVPATHGMNLSAVLN